MGVPAGCQPADVATCGHAYLLIPRDEKHPGQCEGYSMIEVGAPPTSALATEFPATMKRGSESPGHPVDQFRNRLIPGYHTPGQTAALRD